MKYGVIILVCLVFATGLFLFYHPLKTTMDTEVGNSIPISRGKTLTLESSAFAHNSPIPSRFTCDGRDIHPALKISGVPDGAKSLVLIMDDPDAPAGIWIHWVKFNISPRVATIDEGDENFGTAGKGTSGSLVYQGPCPPSGTHHYIFRLYALDAELPLKEGATKPDLIKAMGGHILDQTELIGLYKRGQ